MRPPPLDGLLVLDLSRVLAGPLATMLLADLGARVVKVEDPRGGDATRGWKPPEHDGEAAYYLSVNRRKESVAADLAAPEGAELVRRFARKADVLVENFLPGTLDRFGLAIESLRRENPRLVVCSISGWGETGPLAKEPGFDLLAQGASGLMGITGPEDGEPHKIGVALADVLTGWAALAAILAALAARERDGQGAHVLTDIFSSALSGLVNVGENALVSGLEARRYGNAHPSLEPYRPFASATGPFLLACATDRQFRQLAESVLASPELAADARFATNEARVKNRGALVPLLAERFASRPREEWIASCRAARVPAGPVAGVKEALDSPQAAALASILLTRRDGHAPVPTVRPPFRFAGFGEPEAAAPPRLDEDGDRLRREVGL